MPQQQAAWWVREGWSFYHTTMRDGMADVAYTRCFPKQPKDPWRVSYIDQTIVHLLYHHLPLWCPKRYFNITMCISDRPTFPQENHRRHCINSLFLSFLWFQHVYNIHTQYLNIFYIASKLMVLVSLLLLLLSLQIACDDGLFAQCESLQIIAPCLCEKVG